MFVGMHRFESFFFAADKKQCSPTNVWSLLILSEHLFCMTQRLADTKHKQALLVNQVAQNAFLSYSRQVDLIL